MMEIRNPQYTATGAIDCEVNFHGIDWLPFTASPDDTEAHGREIFVLAEAMGPAPYVPQPDPVPAVISRFQARAVLMDAGLLADVELAVGSAGPLVQLAWAEAVEWRRDSPTIAVIAASLDLTDGQLDDLFRAAALIAV